MDDIEHKNHSNTDGCDFERRREERRRRAIEFDEILNRDNATNAETVRRVLRVFEDPNTGYRRIFADIFNSWCTKNEASTRAGCRWMIHDTEYNPKSQEINLPAPWIELERTPELENWISEYWAHIINSRKSAKGLSLLMSKGVIAPAGTASEGVLTDSNLCFVVL